jgi:hypothetical protein
MKFKGFIKAGKAKDRQKEIETFVHMLEEHPELEEKYLTGIRKKASLNRMAMEKIYKSILTTWQNYPDGETRIGTGL